jgi:hypothetical protein
MGEVMPRPFFPPQTNQDNGQKPHVIRTFIRHECPTQFGVFDSDFAGLAKQ